MSTPTSIVEAAKLLVVLAPADSTPGAFYAIRTHIAERLEQSALAKQEEIAEVKDKLVGAVLSLELTSVRVERLNDISEGAARDEGCVFDGAYWHGHEGMAAFHSAYVAYADLWASINGAGSWAANPWVWVLSFRRVVA